MFRTKYVVGIAFLLVLCFVAWAVAAGSLVDQRGVLAGRVLSDGLAVPGKPVREGDILVVVDSIAGGVPAVRANTDGTVREVLVHPGDTIRTGDILVRIEPSHR